MAKIIYRKQRQVAAGVGPAPDVFQPLSASNRGDGSAANRKLCSARRSAPCASSFSNSISLRRSQSTAASGRFSRTCPNFRRGRSGHSDGSAGLLSGGRYQTRAIHSRGACHQTMPASASRGPSLPGSQRSHRGHDRLNVWPTSKRKPGARPKAQFPQLHSVLAACDPDRTIAVLSNHLVSSRAAGIRASLKQKAAPRPKTGPSLRPLRNRGRCPVRSHEGATASPRDRREPGPTSVALSVVFPAPRFRAAGGMAFLTGKKTFRPPDQAPSYRSASHSCRP